MMLPLPATNDAVLTGVIEPALSLLPAAMTSPEAKVMLLAIGRQESGFATRQQVHGPARGLFQFERTGVLGVMHGTATSSMAYELCIKIGVLWGSSSILDALATDDELACGFARLLLWSDPRPLPAIGDCLGAYENYERCWRPGKPSYTRWKQTAYPEAVATMHA